jgi:hypothetical protein
MVYKIMFTKSAAIRNTSGTTLVEAMIAIGVTGLLMLVLANVSMLSGRMFAAFVNYVDLDDSNRIAMDTLTRDLRACQRVTSCSASQLRIENPDGFTLTYQFDSAAGTLTRSEPGVDPKELLTGCDSLLFSLGTRNPIGSTFTVEPTSNVDLAKVVVISWKCSRTILGRKATSENVQTAQIVIRRQG